MEVGNWKLENDVVKASIRPVVYTVSRWRPERSYGPERKGQWAEQEKTLKEILKKETGRFGDRHCDLTVIGDESQIDRFTDALNSCFLTDEEIEQFREGYEFEDPWPKNIVKMINQ